MDELQLYSISTLIPIILFCRKIGIYYEIVENGDVYFVVWRNGKIEVAITVTLHFTVFIDIYAYGLLYNVSTRILSFSSSNETIDYITRLMAVLCD